MTLHSTILRSALGALLVAGAPRADIFPEWISSFPLGASLSAGLGGLVVDPAGVSYLTGTGGTSSNTDVVTVAFNPDGTVLWSSVFDGVEAWHDQARGIALGPDGVVWVTGNTPGPLSYANVLLLKYDAATGALLTTVQYSSAEFTSEHGASVATDAAGNVYVGGGTVGDGGDALVLKFDRDGVFQWRRSWDGPAWGPFSQDNVLKVLVGPDGNPLFMLHGVMASNHPDYVVIKYAAANGSTLWEANWGVNGGDFAEDMEVDAVGDVYVTGIGIDFIDKYSTLKLQGSDGELLWQFYDAKGNDHQASGLYLDGQGGVYVTGAEDPEGDHSNFNDNFFTVKRSAATGAFLWSHSYGANCVGCYDVPTDVRADSAGHVFVAGTTSSPPYSSDQITFVLDASTGVELERGVVPGGPGQQAGSGPLRFDAAENLYNAGTAYGWDTGLKEMSLVKYASLSLPLYQLELPELDAGAGATFEVEDASSFAPQFVIWSAAGTASIPVPALGTTIGLASPYLLFTAASGATGSYAKTLTVPPGITGLTIWFQSVEPGSASPVLKRTVQ
jgi:hypothetical protein